MAYQSTNSFTPEKVKQGGLGGVNLLHGVYVGTVVGNDDSIYTGRIKVHFPEFGAKSAPYHVLLVTPFGGYTAPKESSGDPTQYGSDDSSEQGAPKSYGMWPQPPAIGTEVICAFTARHNVGYLLGSAIGIVNLLEREAGALMDEAVDWAGDLGPNIMAQTSWHRHHGTD